MSRRKGGTPCPDCGFKAPNPGIFGVHPIIHQPRTAIVDEHQIAAMRGDPSCAPTFHRARWHATSGSQRNSLDSARKVRVFFRSGVSASSSGDPHRRSGGVFFKSGDDFFRSGVCVARNWMFLIGSGVYFGRSGDVLLQSGGVYFRKTVSHRRSGDPQQRSGDAKNRSTGWQRRSGMNHEQAGVLPGRSGRCKCRLTTTSLQITRSMLLHRAKRDSS